MSNTNITDNEATQHGGACYCSPGTIGSFSNVLIKGNTQGMGRRCVTWKSTFHILTVLSNPTLLSIFFGPLPSTRHGFTKTPAIIVMHNDQGPSVLNGRRSVLEENEQTSTADDNPSFYPCTSTSSQSFEKQL